ncbi:hypothetical protein ACFVZR_23080 [Streptomyces sp. NPDC058316]|uniref:hypothetical protein n=1 Tax=unclassified Streptomyces TaxID=2593676 RepID=UPI003321EF07
MSEPTRAITRGADQAGQHRRGAEERCGHTEVAGRLMQPGDQAVLGRYAHTRHRRDQCGDDEDPREWRSEANMGDVGEEFGAPSGPRRPGLFGWRREQCRGSGRRHEGGGVECGNGPTAEQAEQACPDQRRDQAP